MSNESFVKEEKLNSRVEVVRDTKRLVGELHLLKQTLPLSVLLIVLASATPSYFRWYVGKLAESDRAFTVRGLTFVAMAGAFFRITAWGVFELSGLWSSQGLHRRMVGGLARARTTYFDENPSGRLINRLVSDFNEVRFTAVIFLGDLLNAGTEVLSVAALSTLVNPWAALLAIPLLAWFAKVQRHRSPMIAHARSLSATATSRVIDRKTDLIEGREIFSLYGKRERLLSRLNVSFSDYVRAQMLVIQIETWSSFWIRLGAEAFSWVVLIFLSVALSRGRVDAALAGVVLSALFGISSSINWLDFATSYYTRSLTHVRRVFEFVDLPTEESEERALGETTSPVGPRASFRGIRFENYTMSYRRDTPTILQGLDLEIPEGIKLALIGRTGSGKTSVAQALLRMVYVRSGDVSWDGQSIFGIDLNDLRRRFAVVPQFPYLFDGTLRSNLDRTGTTSDSLLEKALLETGLDLALDLPVREGGQNLSLGQRQLLCLARAMASPSKRVVILDEPTSGLDPETDARLSRVLRTALADRTVITIAHRKESLGTYDQVVEMSEGRIVRRGTPAQILL